MNTRILIDGVVQPTTVLIAQLATWGGLRAPLAHVAGQAFLGLAKELERQGGQEGERGHVRDGAPDLAPN